MATYLDALLDGARQRAADARAARPLEAIRERALDAPAPAGFHDALAAPGVALIAEIKRASPSKGPIAPDLDAVAQAAAYRTAGAAAISVLTEPSSFHGSLGDLADVSSLGTPTLRKDFVVDEVQIWEARLAGAAAVLLIVAALDEPTLARLNDVAREAGLDVLVEVHDEAESAAAARIDARIVGVNARDLRTFAMDPDGFARLRATLPSSALAVAESGIRGPDDVRRARDEGADAVLVGESLVRAADPRAAAASLVDAGRPTPAPDAGPDAHPTVPEPEVAPVGVTSPRPSTESP
ncbi:MAG: indole-3-glycerol phosphate synthase TrpC [Nitriliruptoraceae bacterium]|nr:indole-3-glycerol phosphate synthase TrpC [Nitriliruptoraceae bacterium]